MEHGHWDHGYSLHSPELNVPWIVRLPDSIRAGERISGATGLLDVMPTLLERVGLPVPDGLQGRALLGESDPGEEPRSIFASGVKHGEDQHAIRRGDLKLIRTPSTGDHALFDVVGDPGERTDLAGSRPEEATSLLRLLTEQAEIDRALSEGVSGEQREIPEELLERLRSLGYVD
jgi:arylsulfatase A-like enzyme